LSENCEIKSVKANGKVSLEKAEVNLKESVFGDVKKNVLKERTLLRSSLKVIDL